MKSFIAPVYTYDSFRCHIVGEHCLWLCFSVHTAVNSEFNSASVPPAGIHTVRWSDALINGLVLQIKCQTDALTKDIPPTKGSRFTHTHTHRQRGCC